MKIWKVFETEEDCYSADLTEALNNIEEDGWNIASIMGKGYNTVYIAAWREEEP